MALCKGKTIYQALLGIYKQHISTSYFSTNQVLSNMYKDRVPSVQNIKELNALCIDDKPVEKKIRIPAKSEFSSAVTYDSIVQKFITILMRDGKKEKTREIVEQVLENIKMKQIENYHRATTDAEKAMVVTDPLKIFHGAVENCKPLLILKTIVKGGSSYRVPVYCHERRRLRVGINFIIKTCDTRKRKVPLSTVLATEILQAYNNEGNAVGKSTSSIKNVKHSEHLHITDGNKD